MATQPGTTTTKNPSSLPTHTRQWVVESTESSANGFETLKLVEGVEIPKLGDHDVLVQVHYASLNYRDLLIPKGKYPFPLSLPTTPLSDGSCTILATGSRVQSSYPHLTPSTAVLPLFNQTHLSGPITLFNQASGTGGALPGTLRTYAIFEDSALVQKPKSLTHKQASTLPCAGVTAWNALFGLEGQKKLKAGEWVLVQGTGGVSLFGLQFAKAVGAKVIATTSSESKEQKLKQMGADHVINYVRTPEWGSLAKKLADEGTGVHHVLEVGGPKSMAQSLEAVRPEGVISVIGFLGGVKAEGEPGFLEALMKIVTIRGVLVGSRAQFEEMNRCVDATGIVPLVDEREGGKGEWGFEEAKEAYQYMWEKKHFGKVVIKVSEEVEGGDGKSKL